jgi:hypothetical protein
VKGETMKNIKTLYWVGGAYDFCLGAAFLFAPVYLFNLFKITPPNHWGYVTFAAAMLAIFGIMFFNIAKDPKANRNLIPYGIMLKIAYCGTVFGFYFFDSLPKLWTVFGIFDFIFLVLFIWSYKAIGKI